MSGRRDGRRRGPRARAPRRRRAVVPEDVRPVELGRGVVRVLDQRRLPGRETWLRCRTPDEVAEAIRSLAVRGAPAIGVAAGFGMVLAAEASGGRTPRGVLRDVERAGRVLAAARPTAVNLPAAVERCLRAARTAASERRSGGVAAAVRAEAERIAEEEVAASEAIGRFGLELVPEGANVLTHCNTGALAVTGAGTAQAVITAAHREGRRVHAWVDETRPVLQGARLTAWELQRLGVPMTLVADGAAASLMARGLVDVVVVGADRIAANGDVANKIGTYALAVLAKHHGLPFYVAAPTSTIDPATPDGRTIAIEERDPAEVTAPLGVPFAPAGTPAANPAFDVTPAALVTAIVTERGVLRPPYRARLRRAVRRNG